MKTEMQSTRDAAPGNGPADLAAPAPIMPKSSNPLQPETDSEDSSCTSVKLPLAGEDNPAGATNPSLTGKNLEDLERILALALPQIQVASLVLLEIHRRKLYKPKYGSFENYLKIRWQFCRSRGYQLVNFGRALKVSTTVDTAPPANERQARAVASKAIQKSANSNDIHFDARWSRMKAYIMKGFGVSPLEEKKKVVERLKQLIASFERIIRATIPAQPAAALPTPLDPKESQ